MDLHLFLILLYLKLHWRRFHSVMFFSLDERTGGGHDALQTHYRDRLWPGFLSYQFVLRHVHSWRLKQILGSLHKHSHTIWALRAQSLWFNTRDLWLQRTLNSMPSSERPQAITVMQRDILCYSQIHTLYEAGWGLLNNQHCYSNKTLNTFKKCTITQLLYKFWKMCSSLLIKTKTNTENWKQK